MWMSCEQFTRQPLKYRHGQYKFIINPGSQITVISEKVAEDFLS